MGQREGRATALPGIFHDRVDEELRTEGAARLVSFVGLVDADLRNARRLFSDSLDTAWITGVKSSRGTGPLRHPGCIEPVTPSA
jgi:hypothetical protein